MPINPRSKNFLMDKILCGCGWSEVFVYHLHAEIVYILIFMVQT